MVVHEVAKTAIRMRSVRAFSYLAVDLGQNYWSNLARSLHSATLSVYV